MNKLSLSVLLFSAICSTACQLTSQNNINYDAPADIYLDSKFIGFDNVYIESENEIFALDDAMQKMIAEKVAPKSTTRKKTVALLEQIFKSSNNRLAYNSNANVIATEAFHQNQANCLSLTILAHALATEAGLNVQFQDVKIPEYWVRNGHMNMLTGHVNLRVDDVLPDENVFILSNKIIEIDFDPFVVKKSFPKQDISKNTVIAMFYNNKAATALVNDDHQTAYAYLKAATVVDPSFSSAWGNLAILYRFGGYDEQAVKVYRHAIYLDKQNLTAMSNLSLLLHKQGKRKEAMQLDNVLMKTRANNPYYYALLADENYYSGYYAQAIKHYRKAIALDENIHEFYFGLAKTYYKLNNVGRAQRYMKKAIAKTRIDSIEEQYVAKLGILNNQK